MVLFSQGELVNLSMLEKALSPYERKLRAQENLRKRLGVKEVDRATYEKFIIGPVQRFDRRKNAFMTPLPDNPFGEEVRRRFKARTGLDTYDDPLPFLPYGELDPEDRIGQSLAEAAKQPCTKYYPSTLPVTPPEGRVEVKDKAWMARLIKKITLLFGAEMVRITKIDQRWVYQDIDIPHEYAIIAVVSHIRSLNDTAPSHLSGVANNFVYSRLKFITTQLADFICSLGYDAAYRETLGLKPEMLMVPMAIDAGVGELARTGRVLSPEFGINMRLKAVTTDLPVKVDKPISFGVHEFCMVCENCATYCPANAIPFGPPTEKVADPLHNNPGLRKWYIHAERCRTFWAINRRKWTTCGGRCISVCPWNKPISIFHNMMRWVGIQCPELAKKVLIWCDRVVYRRKRRTNTIRS
jgi:reductive dehalogenase